MSYAWGQGLVVARWERGTATCLSLGSSRGYPADMERKRGLGAALRPYQAKLARSIIYPGADPCKTRLAVAFKVIRENCER